MMQIKKKASQDFEREDAHGGTGGRILFLTEGELENRDFQAMTYGFLPGGLKWAWHHHDGVEEIMLVLKGQGVVRDRDGEYDYKEGDIFVFPQNTEHEIENTDREEHEYIFFRTKV